MTVQTVVKSNRTPQILAALRLAGKSNVTVGVHRGSGTYPQLANGREPPTVDKVALWLEYGTENMPARPFLYPAIKRNQGAIAQVAAQSLAKIAYSEWSVSRGLSAIGYRVVTYIQNVIKSNVGDPLSGSWEPPKGYLGWRRRHYPDSGQRTLIASGLLLRSVGFRLHLDKHTEAQEQAAQPIHEDHAPANKHEPKKAAQPPAAPFSRPTPHATQGHGQAREQARAAAQAMKAQHRAQRAAANKDPKAHAAAFAAQRHGFKNRFDKP